MASRFTSASAAELLLVAIAGLLLSAIPAAAVAPTGPCAGRSGGCHDSDAALRLKVIAIFAILVASMIGVCLPLVTRSLPMLHPDGKIFAVVKAFSSGVILATGYMHVLPDSFDDLTSPCLPETPWHKFPFTTFVAMLSAIFTLMVDSFATSIHGKVKPADRAGDVVVVVADAESAGLVAAGVDKDGKDRKLLRHRVVAQVLELGIIVHSVIIGLSLGASDNPCTIRPLVAALCFHQLFEGMGLGGCILQAEYKLGTKAVMAFFFAFTTPFGVALGIGLSNVYSENSPTALIVQGLLNGCSAGLLNYMALVDLLAADFLGPKLQSNMKLQFQAYMAVLLGAGFMSLMAKWA
ncbi:fe(2+) transport protein 1-like [Nymphaea colorata]|nr:fe(2+) transport protein 1-like [Nymphaea colorata]XP_031475902.1 fe(2+) transport protein 1-like [Nymphaea colorata]